MAIWDTTEQVKKIRCQHLQSNQLARGKSLQGGLGETIHTKYLPNCT